MRKALLAAVVVSLTGGLTGGLAMAQEEAAFGGLDPVALAEGREVAGDPGIRSRVGEETLVFASEESRLAWLRGGRGLAVSALKEWGARGRETGGVLAFATARRASNHNLAKDGLAIKGRDPVSYFPEGGGDPEKGTSSLSVEYGGAVYRFASEANRGRFLENPARYEPAYGGWCAYAMSRDELVEVDVDEYIISDDGRLYLFYRDFFTNTRKKWERSKVDLSPEADANWGARTGEGARSGG